jgi:Na+/H+-translocating membrane pyrophosphatase
MIMTRELLFVITIIFATTLKGLLLVAIALKELLPVATMFVALRELMLIA